MFGIRIGNIEELGKVKNFYDSLIEEMQEAEYKPGWKKDIYPTMEMLREALENRELYIGEEEGKTAACMILNQNCNERYQEISWKTEAGPPGKQRPGLARSWQCILLESIPDSQVGDWGKR